MDVAASLNRRVVNHHERRFVASYTQKIAEGWQGFNVVDDRLNRNKDEVGSFRSFKSRFGIFSGTIQEDELDTVLFSFGQDITQSGNLTADNRWRFSFATVAPIRCRGLRVQIYNRNASARLCRRHC